MTIQKKFCPMGLSNSNVFTNNNRIQCDDNCAWFMKQEGSCAMKIIAKEMQASNGPIMVEKRIKRIDL